MKAFAALQSIRLRLIWMGLVSADILPDSYQRWTHTMRIETGVEVKWNAEDPSYLTMEVSAPTKGYVGIGFSPSGGMLGSDIMIGWVDGDGIPHVRDFFAPDRGQPTQDPQQDYDLVAASEREGRTTIRFRRRWDTCDVKNDLIIGNDTMRMIWAWHPTDPVTVPQLEFNWHGANTRGVRSVLMRTPSNQMRFPDVRYSGGDGGDRNLMQWDVALNRVRIDGNRETNYICKIVKFPRTNRKHHVVGFRPIISPDNTRSVHHISVHHCHVPESLGGTRQVFERYVGDPGTGCYSPSTPPEWANHCFAYLFNWAIGSEGEMLPAHVGIPLGGDSDDSTYFKLEVHYDNPARRTFLDSSGLRIFYTNQLRKNDAATLFLGHRITPFQMIPQAQESFRTFSFCSKECTQNGISAPEGLRAVNVMLQTHLTGRKISVRHVRDGRELPPISQDNNYDSAYRQSRLLDTEVDILPGDELIVECDYDTSKKTAATFGGMSNEQEVCQALITYYPKSALTDCRSQPEFYSFFNALGMLNVSRGVFQPYMLPNPNLNQYNAVNGNADLNPPDNTFQLAGSEAGELQNPFDLVRVTSPASIGNLSVGDYMRKLDWRDKGLAKRLEGSLRDGLHYMYCSNTGQRRIPIQQNTLKYPTFNPYTSQRRSTCRGDDDSGGDHERAVAVLLTTGFMLMERLYNLIPI